MAPYFDRPALLAVCVCTSNESDILTPVFFGLVWFGLVFGLFMSVCLALIITHSVHN
jgi:hypothetical protein